MRSVGRVVCKYVRRDRIHHSQYNSHSSQYVLCEATMLRRCQSTFVGGLIGEEEFEHYIILQMDMFGSLWIGQNGDGSRDLFGYLETQHSTYH